MTTSHITLVVPIILSFLCSACASRTSAEEDAAKLAGTEEITDERDPIEGFNRTMFDFNYNVLDKYILRPTAVFYVNYVPEPIRGSAGNFVRNWDEPSSAVNNLLQANWGDSANNLGRFSINTTLGLLGLIDVASHLGMPRKLDSFGEVMGTYGVGNGPYLMLPGAGPTTVRDQSGDFVDNFYWPLATLTFWPKVIQWTVKGLEGRASLLEQDQILEDSLDPYGFVKESYFQNAEFRLYDGKVPEKEPEDTEYLDDYLDEFDE